MLRFLVASRKQLHEIHLLAGKIVNTKVLQMILAVMTAATAIKEALVQLAKSAVLPEEEAYAVLARNRFTEELADRQLDITGGDDVHGPDATYKMKEDMSNSFFQESNDALRGSFEKSLLNNMPTSVTVAIMERWKLYYLNYLIYIGQLP